MLRSMLVAVFFAAVALPGQLVHAQQPAATTAAAAVACPPGELDNSKGECRPEKEVLLQAAIDEKAKTSNEAAERAVDAATGGAVTALKCIDDVGDCILNSFAFFILGFANYLLGLTGVLLNWVVVKTVFQFSTLVGNSQGLLVAWGILRDLGNLLLLFGFVLMGIGTIIDTNKLPDKRAIPKLIIFAILLNFSLFAAEAVIDTSNVLTAAIYAQTNTEPCQTETCDVNYGLSGRLLDSTGLSGIQNVEPEDVGEGTKKLSVIIGLAIFSIIGTIVLLATAIMLMIRAIVLTGLIIVSPIGFAGMAIKPLEKMAQKWWHTLIHQSFFAPVLFILLLITLKVTEGFATGTGNTGLSAALTANGSSQMGIIMVFLLITGGLLASLMAAKSFGAMGADYAIKTAGGIVGGASFGTAGFVGRRTLGAGGAVAARNIKRSAFGATFFGKQFAGVADRAANSSFDGRVVLPKKIGIGKLVVPDLGKPNKTAAKGYNEIEKKVVDAKVKYGNSLEMSDAAKEQEKKLTEKRKANFDEYKENLASLNKNLTNAKSGRAEAKSKFDTQEKALEALAANAGPEKEKINKQIAELVQQQNTLLAQGRAPEATALNKQRDSLNEQLNSIDKVSENLEKIKADHAAEDAAAVARIKIIEDAQVALKKTAKDKQDAIDAEIKLNNPKGRYADRLENSFFTKFSTVTAEANRKAAKKIGGDFKKSKKDKSIEEIKKAIESGSKDSGSKVDDLAEALAEDKEEEITL